tara:strand:- start:2977 stop:6309 length:3333 start_codon:yes stop_codon:yes gene_type:complete
MADCNDLNKELQEIDEELRLLDQLEAQLDSVDELAKATPDLNTTTIKTYTGDEIKVNAAEHAALGELTAVEMGEEAVIDLVTDGFKTGRRPTGETGRALNYRQLDPSQENLAALLEVLGFRRANTKRGIELKRPFTQQAASKALMRMAGESGANPRDLAKSLSRRFKGIDNLPASVYSVAKARWETSTEFAAMLEDMADAIDESRLTDEMRVELGNASRWAHYFEQLDAAVRRRIGQSLKSLQFKADDDQIQLVDVGKDVTELTFEDIAEGSLLAQVLEHVDNGDAMKLRRIAKAKRVMAVTKSPINRPNFLVELEVLNQYRKNNLFSSVSSWGVRNLSSGFVAANLTLEDIAGGAQRVGVLGEWHATAYAANKVFGGFGMAWQNATDSLFTGKSRMAVNALRDINPEVLAENQKFVEDTLTTSWDNFFGNITLKKNPFSGSEGYLPIGTVLSFLNVVNASTALVVGKLVAQLPGRFKGSTAGYMASFRLLNGGDEFLRTMAWTWKTEHEAMLRAIEDSRGVISEKTGKPISMAEVEEIAEGYTNKALFSGRMTDDDLARFRKERNATLGMPPGKEVDTEELRLQLFNNLNGVPNVGDEIADIGVKRMEDVTFTGKLPAGVQSVQMLRANPLGGYLLPVFRSAYHGVAYLMSRNFVSAIANALVQQIRHAKGTVSKADLIDARSRALVSSMLAGSLWVAWSKGIWNDGGPSRADKPAREAWLRRNPMYSINVGFGNKPVAKIQTKSIDFFDMLGFTSDIYRAFDEGIIKGGDFEYAMNQAGTIIANTLSSKAGLTGLTSIMNAWTNPERYDMQWAMQRQMSGIMPNSGLLGNFARMNNEPGAYPDKRRDLTLKEAGMMGKSQVGQFLQGFGSYLGDGLLGNLPGYDELTDRPYKRDWTGGAMDRPMGLPADATIPYMPLIPSQSPVFRYLEEHGFGGKPRADAKVSLGLVSSSDLDAITSYKDMQMTNKEEALYRQKFLTEVGTIDAATLGLPKDTVIDKYVLGKNFNQAMLAIMEDEAYNAVLASPVLSPSRKVAPNKTLEQRQTLSKMHNEAYKPIRHIIDYYDRLGLAAMYAESDTFQQRHAAYLKKYALEEQERREALSGLGTSRQ